MNPPGAAQPDRTARDRTARDYTVAALTAFVAGLGLWWTAPESYAFLLGPVPAPPVLALAFVAGGLALRLMPEWIPGVTAAPSRPWRPLVVAGAGLVWALVPIAIDLAFPFARDINVALPAALVFYPVVAVLVSAVFHLVPLALAMWLVGPHRAWPAILVLAALEPAFQVGLGGGPWPQQALTALHVYLFALAQLALLRCFGYAESLALRLGFYLGWHIIWGHLRLELMF